ncbi:hypothetical protein ACERK3_08525 [Phycisphaerales bacterium AB-hyl4]|uniref:Uncharacterized protein n=1 Tax=Natronomicrosphaera hydrolytica TaxID=3242702 RepID=A0ABV4U426_9BACT
MASSTLRMICPNLKCRSVLSVPAAARGKVVRCRQCRQRVQVPVIATPPAKPAPAAADEMVQD